MFQKILLPIDGSTASLRAAETIAEGLGALPDAQVTIIMIVEPLRLDETDYDDEIVIHHNARMRDRAQSVLDTTARLFEARNITYCTKIIEADPASAAIADEAVAGNFDIIAMGSRGLGMKKNNLNYLGSVAEHVIRRVSIPVLVIPIHKDK